MKFIYSKPFLVGYECTMKLYNESKKIWGKMKSKHKSNEKFAQVIQLKTKDKEIR